MRKLAFVLVNSLLSASIIGCGSKETVSLSPTSHSKVTSSDTAMAEAPDRTPPSPPRNSGKLQGTELIGRRFRSVERREIGLGPEGEVLGYWYLTFHSESVTWDHSDMQMTVGYRLRPNGAITADFLSESDHRDSIAGDFHFDENRIFWQQQWYEAVEAKSPPE